MKKRINKITSNHPKYYERHKKIEYLNKRLDVVEHDINLIYNSYKFNDVLNFDKYEKYLKLDSKIKNIKLRMKIITMKIYEIGDFNGENLYVPHK